MRHAPALPHAPAPAALGLAGAQWAHAERRAATGGEPTLAVVVGLIDGERHEPPHVEVVEHAIRGMAAANLDGATTGRLFEDGLLALATMRAGESADGPMYRTGWIIPQQDRATDLLRAMRRGDRAHGGMSPEPTQFVSLAGLIASLGKLAEQCAYDARAIID